MSSATVLLGSWFLERFINLLKNPLWSLPEVAGISFTGAAPGEVPFVAALDRETDSELVPRRCSMRLFRSEGETEPPVTDAGTTCLSAGLPLGL